jgi:hypothetical protein
LGADIFLTGREIVARERRHWLAGWVLGADILLTGREIVARDRRHWLAGWYWVQKV